MTRRASIPRVVVLDYDCAKVVGARLRELRKDAELTQVAVAQRMGSHRPIVARLELGRHEPDLASVARYAAALELDLCTVLVCLNGAWRYLDRTTA